MFFICFMTQAISAVQMGICSEKTPGIMSYPVGKILSVGFQFGGNVLQNSLPSFVHGTDKFQIFHPVFHIIKRKPSGQIQGIQPVAKFQHKLHLLLFHLLFPLWNPVFQVESG